MSTIIKVQINMQYIITVYEENTTNKSAILIEQS